MNMRKTNRGTPQTLTKANSNGVEDYQDDQRSETIEKCIEHIRVNVADFIRNSLGPIYLADLPPEAEKLLKSLVDRLK